MAAAFESRKCPGCGKEMMEISIKCRACGLESLQTQKSDDPEGMSDIDVARRARFRELNQQGIAKLTSNSTYSNSNSKMLLIGVGAVLAIVILLASVTSKPSVDNSQNNEIACQQYGIAYVQYSVGLAFASSEDGSKYLLKAGFASQLLNLASTDISSVLKDSLITDARNIPDSSDQYLYQALTTKFCNSNFPK